MILASQSPRRRDLLSSAGFALEVVPADIDEERLPGETPSELVRRLAAQKAEAVRATLRHVPDDHLLVAADTIVWIGDEALGKPCGAAGARDTLRALSGRTHHVSTGVCAMLLAPDGTCARREGFVETTDVTFHELSDAEIDAYVATGEPLDKAGAYGIQGAGALLVKRIEGDYANVVGLPLARLVRVLGGLMGDEEGLVARALREGGAHA